MPIRDERFALGEFWSERTGREIELLVIVVGITWKRPSRSLTVRFGQTISARREKRGSPGFVPLLQNAQEMSIAMTTVLPLP